MGRSIMPLQLLLLPVPPLLPLSMASPRPSSVLLLPRLLPFLRLLSSLSPLQPLLEGPSKSLSLVQPMLEVTSTVLSPRLPLEEECCTPPTLLTPLTRLLLQPRLPSPSTFSLPLLPLSTTSKDKRPRLVPFPSLWFSRTSVRVRPTLGCVKPLHSPHPTQLSEPLCPREACLPMPPQLHPVPQTLLFGAHFSLLFS